MVNGPPGTATSRPPVKYRKVEPTSMAGSTAGGSEALAGAATSAVAGTAVSAATSAGVAGSGGAGVDFGAQADKMIASAAVRINTNRMTTHTSSSRCWSNSSRIIGFSAWNARPRVRTHPAIHPCAAAIRCDPHRTRAAAARIDAGTAGSHSGAATATRRATAGVSSVQPKLQLRRSLGEESLTRDHSCPHPVLANLPPRRRLAA